jgi:hypothetical protein
MKRDHENQQAYVYVKKHRGIGGHRCHRVIPGLETYRDLSFQEEFTKKPTTEERRVANAVFSSAKNPMKMRKVKGKPVDGIRESNERNHPRLAHVEDMLLKREHAVFYLRLHLDGPVGEGCALPFMMRCDDHVYIQTETYYQKMEAFNLAKEAAEDSDGGMSATDFWVSVLHESFTAEKDYLGYCNTCLRMFYSPLTKCNRLPFCQDCFEKVVEDRCDAREWLRDKEEAAAKSRDEELGKRLMTL